MSEHHLDRALAEEFAGEEETIHQLKTRDAAFRELMERNHFLWAEIQKIQAQLEPAEQARREQLERQRLVLLDDIATRIRAAKG